MKRSFIPLLCLLVFLSMGADTAFVGCGLGDGGTAGIACTTGSDGDDPCDYVVTLQARVISEGSGIPVSGAEVTVDSDPPSTRYTDGQGVALWEDTSLFTGFSADCGGRDVGTVEPYGPETSFSYEVFVSAAGLADASTTFTINRQTRELSLVFPMVP
jgi:hypothetical protein